MKHDKRPYTLADLVVSLELRFPWLWADDGAGSGADIINALVEWHAEVSVQAADDLAAVAESKRQDYFAAHIAADDFTKRRGEYERGSIPLPLLAFQACAAVGLASGVLSVLSWAQSVLGSVL